ncbi:MAG TPA: flippase [Verrucomicrobiae bacterium]|nr:flippase [Verrucomicrobiae bacterium]
MGYFFRLWTRLKQSVLLRNTIWMFLGQGMRQLLRAVYFLIIPRALGVEQYGLFVGVTSLAAILAPFSTLGIGNLLIKNVSRDRNVFAEYWGNSLILTAASGGALVALMMGISKIFIPGKFPWLLVFVVAVSDLLFAKVLDVGSQAFQACDLMKKTAQLNVVASMSRVVGAIFLVVLVRHSNAMTWSWIYLSASVITTLITMSWVNRQLGHPVLALWRIKPEMLEGCYFSVSMSSQSIYNDIDKTMLVQLSTLDGAGIYAAAYRLIDVAFLPVRSLLWAMYPSFFRHGQAGIGASQKYARRLLPRAFGYSLLACAALFVGAPIVPHLLGAEYARTTIALRWLAPLPLLKTLHYFVADSLTGAGMQGLRTAVQVGVAIFNVLLNLWLIPAYSWRGAAWSSLASDGMLAVSLWVLVFWLGRQRAPGELAASEISA